MWCMREREACWSARAHRGGDTRVAQRTARRETPWEE